MKNITLNSRRIISFVLLLALGIFLHVGFYLEGMLFAKSLVAEISGVLFELFVIIAVFNVWDERKKKSKLITSERRLRELLIFFLNNFSGPRIINRAIRFFGEDYSKNKTYINDIIRCLSEEEVAEEARKKIIEHCKIESSTFESLLPVASQLTNEHFKSWIRMVYHVNLLVRESDLNSTEVNGAIIKILENIKRFDKASFDEGLYVGAALKS